MNISLVNYDISKWKTSRNGTLGGLYMSIGFGQTQMAGADVIICGFQYFNKSRTTFNCFEGNAIKNDTPSKWN